jgi:hypothetical protein
MTSDQAVGRLREGLAWYGFTVTDDAVVLTGSGYATIRLPNGIDVWCGPELFRWIGSDGKWRFHDVDDAEGAADLLRDELTADRSKGITSGLVRRTRPRDQRRAGPQLHAGGAPMPDPKLAGFRPPRSS